MTPTTLEQAKDMCRAVCGHLPLPGHRVMIGGELAEGELSEGGVDRFHVGGGVYRRELSSVWLENQSPSGTPASSSVYRVLLIRYDSIQDFEVCPLCGRRMSYHGARGHRMCCSRCNRLFPLDERNVPLVFGEDLECS